MRPNDFSFLSYDFCFPEKKKKGNVQMQYKKNRKVPCCFLRRSDEGLAKGREIVGVETLKVKEPLGSYL